MDDAKRAERRLADLEELVRQLREKVDGYRKERRRTQRELKRLREEHSRLRDVAWMMWDDAPEWWRVEHVDHEQELVEMGIIEDPEGVAE